MTSSQSLEIRDDASLRFVCAVVAQHLVGSIVPTDERVGTWRVRMPAMPRIVVYLHGMESGVALLWPLLRQAFAVPDASTAVPLGTFTLSNGGTLTVIDAGPMGVVPPSTASDTAGIVVVVKAPVTGLPPPDLSIAALISPSKRSTKRKPYLLDLVVQTRGMSLGTALLPRYWSLHPAYEIIRTARLDRSDA